MMTYNVDIVEDNISVKVGNDIVPLSSYNLKHFAGKTSSDVGSDIKLQLGHNVVVATGINEYYGYITSDVEVYVNPSNLTSKLQYGSQLYDDGKLSVTYTGEEIRPTPVLWFNTTTIPLKVDPWHFTYYDRRSDETVHQDFDTYYPYLCSYANNISVNQNCASVDVYSPYHLETTKALKFFIMPHPLQYSDIAMHRAVAYQWLNEANPIISIGLNGHSLIQGVDYTVSCGGNKDLGEASCVVKGYGNFRNSLTCTYNVSGDLGDSTTKIYVDDEYSMRPEDIMYKYNGSQRKPTDIFVKLKNRLNLAPSSNEYVVEYPSDCVYAGRKNCRVVGRNNCANTFKEFYYGISADIAFCTINNFPLIMKLQNEPLKPQPSLSYQTPNGIVNLIPNVDIEYVYTNPDGYSQSGLQTMSIVGKTYWLGTKNLSFMACGKELTYIERTDGRFFELSLEESQDLTHQLIRQYIGSNDEIKRIIVGSATEHIEDNLLANCHALVEADFSDARVEIPAHCFQNCKSLITVKFPMC